MLIPKSLDPVARGRKVPVPDERPTETIAKLFPPVDPLKDPAMDTRTGVKPVEAAPAAGASKDAPSVKEPPKSAAPAPVPAAQASAAATSIAKPVPLPEARPNLAPPRDVRRQRQYRFQ